MADFPNPLGIYTTSPPRGKPSAWAGIAGYIRYLIWGLAIIGFLRLLHGLGIQLP